MTIFKSKYFVLLIIVLVAAFLRFNKIDQVPVSLYWDEVSSGYNAYSIAKTGKDEFGNPYPLLFRAFEDYKTPANIYLTALLVKTFPLNEFSARFTSAFLGSLTVLITFFLTQELLLLGDKKKRLQFIDGASLLSAALLAISPWHIQFSRTGFEANTGLFFVTLATFLFLKSVNKGFRIFFPISMFFFAISIYFYRSIWVFTPLFLASLIFIYRGKVFSNLKTLILGGVVFLIVLAPFVPVMVSPQGRVRAEQTSVINNSTEQVLEASKKQDELRGNYLGKILFNRRLVYIGEIMLGYVKHFSPSFLFLKGDGNLRHGVSGMGVLYLWEAPFIILGLIFIYNKLDRKIFATLLAWIVIAPIPAALSVPSPHALRSLNLLPVPYVLESLGLIFLFTKLSRKIKILFLSLIIIIASLSLFKYLDNYYNKWSVISSADWGDGYKELFLYTESHKEEYDRFIISGHYWQPYAYFLFYSKYPPEEFQKSGSKKGFGKYVFGGTSWDMNGKEFGDLDLEEIADGKTALVALSPIEYSLQKDNLNKIGEIINNNNELVFILSTIK